MARELRLLLANEESKEEISLIFNEEEITTMWNWLKHQWLPPESDIIKLMYKIEKAFDKVSGVNMESKEKDK